MKYSVVFLFNYLRQGWQLCLSLVLSSAEQMLFSLCFIGRHKLTLTGMFSLWCTEISPWDSHKYCITASKTGYQNSNKLKVTGLNYTPQILHSHHPDPLGTTLLSSLNMVSLILCIKWRKHSLLLSFHISTQAQTCTFCPTISFYYSDHFVNQPWVLSKLSQKVSLHHPELNADVVFYIKQARRGKCIKEKFGFSDRKFAFPTKVYNPVPTISSQGEDSLQKLEKLLPFSTAQHIKWGNPMQII